MGSVSRTSSGVVDSPGRRTPSADDSPYRTPKNKVQRSSSLSSNNSRLNDSDSFQVSDVSDDDNAPKVILQNEAPIDLIRNLSQQQILQRARINSILMMTIQILIIGKSYYNSRFNKRYRLLF